MIFIENTKNIKSFAITFLLLFGLFFTSIFCFCQGQEFLKGKILDTKTNLPVSFATVRYKNKSIGVVSNLNGDFQLPNKYLDSVDTLIISCIGYFNQIIITSQLKRDDLNILKLESSAFQLSEIQIKARSSRMSAEKIVKLAIEQIPRNYPPNPFSYIAYYRDYQWKENTYTNLNEAIVEIFDSGFNTNDIIETKIRLYDYNANGLFLRDPSTEIGYDNSKHNKFIPGAVLSPFGGNELSILRIHDAIRNYNIATYSYVDTLSTDFVKNHFFSIRNYTLFGDVQMYCISFDSKIMVAGLQHFAKGLIYIEKGNYAIHKIEYRTYEKKSSGTHMLYEIQLEYSRHNLLMYLNYISFNNFFKVKSDTDFKVQDVLFDRSINAFVIEFSHVPEALSAASKKNYDTKYSGKNLAIKRIDTHKLKENLVYLYLEDDFSRIEKQDLILKMKIEFGDIRDTEGRKVNKITYREVNQFRELFSQELTNEVMPTDTLFIWKDKPLFQNRRASIGYRKNYWMNTPLRTK